MNDLTEYELEVITTGRKLLSDTNTGNYIKFAGGFGDDIIHVFKNNGVTNFPSKNYFEREKAR